MWKLDWNFYFKGWPKHWIFCVKLRHSIYWWEVILHNIGGRVILTDRWGRYWVLCLQKQEIHKKSCLWKLLEGQDSSQVVTWWSMVRLAFGLSLKLWRPKGHQRIDLKVLMTNELKTVHSMRKKELRDMIIEKLWYLWLLIIKEEQLKNKLYIY